MDQGNLQFVYTRVIRDAVPKKDKKGSLENLKTEKVFNMTMEKIVAI